jgi:hypothetical protein
MRIGSGEALLGNFGLYVVGRRLRLRRIAVRIAGEAPKAVVLAGMDARFCNPHLWRPFLNPVFTAVAFNIFTRDGIAHREVIDLPTRREKNACRKGID